MGDAGNLRILLCDAAKFGAAGLLSYASLSDFGCLITDKSCPDALRLLCEKNETALLIAE